MDFMLIHAAAAYDPMGRLHRPAGIELRPQKPPRFGPRRDFEADPATLHRPRTLVLPGLINAHTHLQLNATGPRPHPGGGFVDWVRMVRDTAATGQTPPAMPPGVAAVGDIASDLTGQPAPGIIRYIELFGLGTPFENHARDAITATGEGLQPHAPYSAGPAIYAAATDASIAASPTARPLSTHLAESPEELAFVAGATGPLRDYLKKLGKWDEAFAGNYTAGLSPVQWMRPHLERAPWLLAHCNFVDDEDIALLAATGASVAYCPIASDYFGYPGGHLRDNVRRSGHRYRDMLSAGVNVCLGSDSVVCQPPGEPQPLGILPQMRHLYRRDRTDPAMLLAMATTNGIKALRLPHAPPAVIAVPFDPDDLTDPLEQALTRDTLATTLTP